VTIRKFRISPDGRWNLAQSFVVPLRSPARRRSAGLVGNRDYPSADQIVQLICRTDCRRGGTDRGPQAVADQPALRRRHKGDLNCAPDAGQKKRSVKVSEFERRQLAAVRKERDQEYEAMTGLNAKPSKDENPVRTSSNSRT
jgi:hypothetical protein